MSILHQVPSEAKIRRELKSIIFGKQLFCPCCASKQVKRYGKRYSCKRCRKPFSLTSVSWLKGTKLPLQTLWLLLWCWTNKVAGEQAQRLCGVSKPTQRSWYEKFRARIPREQLRGTILQGIVQMDEAYRGGKRSGYAIVAAKERQGRDQLKRRKMAFQMVSKPSVDRKDALTFMQSYVMPESKLHTDGAGIYRGIENWWRVSHQYEVHRRWEFSLTSEIEGLFGTLTTFIRRMYHHVTRDTIEEVLCEFQARQMYPEWFVNPQSFLRIALQPIARISEEKPATVFFHPNYIQFPLTNVSS